MSQGETFHHPYILKVCLRMATGKIPTDDQPLSFILTVVIPVGKYFIIRQMICKILAPVVNYCLLDSIACSVSLKSTEPQCTDSYIVV